MTRPFPNSFLHTVSSAELAEVIRERDYLKPEFAHQETEARAILDWRKAEARR